MDYMFQPGFLGTRAPFFMDFVTLIVTLLPLLIALVILLAKKGMIRLHVVLQLFLFLFSVIIVSYFEYGVRVDGGFKAFVKESSLSESFIFWFLMLHILISIVTLVWWSRTIVTGIIAYRKNLLPGNASGRHRKLGIQGAWGIFLTSLTGLWVYLFLFLF
jgi:putative membrane protein